TNGWGSFDLPADANRRDNTVYFVYGPETQSRASVVSVDPQSGRFLKLAASGSGKSSQGLRILQPSEFQDFDGSDESLLIWQSPLPDEQAAKKIQAFVEQGGVAIFFPPGSADPRQFNGIGWGDLQTIDEEKGFLIRRWDEEQGPLAKTDEGLNLPLPQTVFQRRQVIVGPRN